MHLSSFTLASVALLTLAQTVQGRGDFSHSCSGYYIDGNNFLRASCKNDAGGTSNSALNLNACIGISGNSLVCQPKYVPARSLIFAWEGLTSSLVGTMQLWVAVAV